jgi:beta-glucosidase
MPTLETPTSTSTESSPSVSWQDEMRRNAIRWTGTIVAPESGEYRVGYVSHGGARIWLSNQQIVYDWTWHDAPSMVTGAITLEANRKYPIKVEAFQFGEQGDQHLVWSVPSQRGDDAVEAARQADVVVFVGGLSARIEGEEMRVNAPGFAGGDRTSIDLPAPQQQLLERVHATGKPVVLVLMNGSALGVNWADEHLPAIVEAWYPGGQGGAAVASLLAGDYSPAGRLPVTFYKSVDQLPAFTDYSMAGRTYRYFDGEPLYAFGHGLSFTTFKYDNARVSRSKIKASDEVIVSVDVTNTGKMSSDEVVQLYLSHEGVKGAPIRSLQGFERISLAAGEKKTVEFKLRDRALSIVDEQGVRRVQPGKVNVWVGGGQPVTRKGVLAVAGAQTQFSLMSSAVLPL